MSFSERQGLIQALAWEFQLKRSFILRGEYGHAGSGAPFVHEAYFDICSILLYIGDVFRYIALDDRGFFDPLCSNVQFFEHFVQCLELMHEWCIRNPPYGEDNVRSWYSCGVDTNVLMNIRPCLRSEMSTVVFSHASRGPVVPAGMVLFSDIYVRDLFLQTSKFAFELAELDSQLQLQPLRDPQNIQSLRFYLTKGPVPQGEMTSLSEHTYVLLVRALSNSGSRKSSLSSDCQFYWSFHSFDRWRTLYENVIAVVRMRQGRIDW